MLKMKLDKNKKDFVLKKQQKREQEKCTKKFVDVKDD
jgi:hypothetical protein